MTSDSGIEALSMMEEYKVMHLPIVNAETLLGVISENDILAMNDPEEAIGSSELSMPKPYVFDYQHVYDVIKEASEQRLSVIPVVDKKLRYKGVICLMAIVRYISRFSALDQPGGIIVLEMNEHDYSLGQIAQLIESNDAKVLSVYVNAIPNTGNIELSLKINKMDLNPVIQTLERYDYHIKSYIFENKQDELGERFDSLMKYLNI